MKALSYSDSDEEYERTPLKREVSLSEAVMLARNACRLKYLTGAAPVVYGIPVHLKSNVNKFTE